MSRYLKLFKKHKHIEKTRWHPCTHVKNPLVCRTNVSQCAARRAVDVYVYVDPSVFVHKEICSFGSVVFTNVNILHITSGQ